MPAATLDTGALIVMASAAQRGDVVFTSNLDDLARLQRHFPSVRLLRV